MKIDRAYAYLDSLQPAGINYKLNTIKKALQALGNPQLRYPAIIVAGTNGKGSTANIIASVLSACGYKTGLYTSPSLVEFRERIRIDGRMIRTKTFAGLVSRLSRELKMAGVNPTHFEFSTALAFEYFKNRVDIAVMEVGMGGRLDATNLCNPILSVIMPISFDHSGFLGETLAEIAGEKAAVMRRGVTCVCAAQPPEAMAVIEARAKKMLSRLILSERDFSIRKNGKQLQYSGLGRQIDNITPPLIGAHQNANLAVALAALEVLDEKGFIANDTCLRKGLKNTRWPARLQKIGTRPQTWLDGAHNESGAAALAEHFASKSRSGKRVLLFTSSSDKQTAQMLYPLARQFETLVATEYSDERSSGSAAIAEIGRDLFATVTKEPSPAKALHRARELAGEKGTVLVTGSLYLAGEILALRKI
jgi:dihydrofolate synthase / folylpolyglutamate synthase